MARILFALALPLLLSAPLLAADEPLRLPVPVDLLTGARTDWYGIYAEGGKIGWGRTTLGRSDVAGEPALVSSDEMHVRARMLGETYEMDMASQHVYDLEPPHALRHGWQRTTRGDDRQRVEVTRKGDVYRAVIEQAGGRREVGLGTLDVSFTDLSTTVAWFRTPREVGQRVVVRSFEWDDLVATTESGTVRAVNHTMADGVPITWYEVAAHSERNGDMGTYRMDGRGRMLSARIGGGAIELRLEPEEVARTPGASVDLFVSRMARIDVPLGDPRRIVEMVVRIEGPGADSVGSGPRQTATYAADTKTLTLEIGKRHGTPAKATQAEIQRALEELPSYPIRHEKVVALAKAAVGEVTDRATQVVRLVAFVDAYVRDDYHAEPLTVLDLIEVRRGDCSEHAALFTTLARALGIPAREVSGLAYMGDREQAFGGHAWNEVLVDGRWVPVDPTWGEVELDATHIRQATEGTGAAAYFALGGARIELISAVRR